MILRCVWVRNLVWGRGTDWKCVRVHFWEQHLYLKDWIKYKKGWGKLQNKIGTLNTISYPCKMSWRPIGLWDVEAPTFYLDNRVTDGGLNTITVIKWRVEHVARMKEMTNEYKSLLWTKDFTRRPTLRYDYIKIKVNLSLCLINQALCHQDIWGSGGIAPPFLTSSLDGGVWSASRPGRFTLRERVRSIQWIGNWMGPRAGLEGIEKR
jgi:hypothetical protein